MIGHEQRGILLLGAYSLSGPDSAKHLRVFSRETRRMCTLRAGALPNGESLLDVGPHVCIRRVKWIHKPWHSPRWQGFYFGVTHSAPSQASSTAATKPAITPACHEHLRELQCAAALNSVTPCQTQLGTAPFNTQSPLIALQTRFCGVEISFLS